MRTKLKKADKNKLKLSIDAIDRIIETGNSALEKFPTDHYELELFMYINLLERFTMHLNGINLLLKQYEKSPNLEGAIGLIARAGLLDFMLISYLSSYQADIGHGSDPKGEIYRQEINKVLCDQLHYTFKFIKATKNIGLINDDDYKSVIESSVHNYSFLFSDMTIDYQNPEKKLLAQETISPNRLFKRIHSHSLTTKFSLIYDLYTYYSKYEHFGIMTHFLQRQGIEIDLERIFAAIHYLIKGIGATFRYLSGPKSLLEVEIEKVDKLEEQFIEAINNRGSQ